MRDRVDLHVHSNRSDGIESPAQLVARAAYMGLGGLALTDHDTITGLNEFLHAQCDSPLVRIAGVEISTEYQEHEVHILGYFVPDDSSQLEVSLKQFERARSLRMTKMVQRLKEIGIVIDEENLQQRLVGVKSPGRPHLARVLADMGVVRDVEEAFKLYLGRGRPAYIKKEMMHTKEAIALLRSIGSVPVLAHPLILRPLDLRWLIEDLYSAGLMGIEVFYDYSTMGIVTDLDEIIEIADRLHLIKTGGSDHHGDNSHDTLGNTTVSIEVAMELQQAAMSLR